MKLHHSTLFQLIHQHKKRHSLRLRLQNIFFFDSIEAYIDLIVRSHKEVLS